MILIKKTGIKNEKSKIKPIFLKKYKQKNARPRASLKRETIEFSKPKEVSLRDLEEDIRETKALLYLILALTVSLFGLMLGIVIKIFF